MLHQQPSSEPERHIQGQSHRPQNDRHRHVGRGSSLPRKSEQRHWERLVVSGILLLGLTLQCIGAWQDSQTTDEAVHLSAGYSYWQTNDHRLNPEHPPLVKLFAAMPLLIVPNLSFSTTFSAWQQPDQWSIGSHLLYQSSKAPLDARELLFISRIPMILLWAGLGLLLWWTSRRLWGHWSGILTLSLFVLDPTFLGHGHLITTDIGMSLGFLATLILLERFLQHPGWKTAAVVALVLGLTELAKFSAIILWGLVPLITLIRMIPKNSPVRWKHLGMLAVTLAFIPLLLSGIVYGFDRGNLAVTPLIKNAMTERAHFDTDPGALAGQPPFIKLLYRVTNPDTGTGKAITSVLNANLPVVSYIHGILETANHDFWGHSSYLLGHTGTRGWWYYFPVAIAVKLPTLTFLLMWIALGYLVIRWIRVYHWRIPNLFWTLGFPPLVFLAWSMTGHINIGVRHVFPVMMFIPLWIGSLTTISKLRAYRGWMIGGVGVIGLVVTLLAWPHTIAYFAGWTGGTAKGHTILQDSNFDWGQDLWRLKSELAKNPLPEPHIASVGSAPLDHFFPKNSIGILTDEGYDKGERPTGTTIVSAGILFDPNQPVNWLRKRTPTKVIGSVFYVFPSP